MALCLLAGCAVSPQYPAQEMSDARQAIYAAKEASADKPTPEALNEAEQLLQQATKNLEDGHYDEARELALNAKQAAMQARDDALTGTE